MADLVYISIPATIERIDTAWKEKSIKAQPASQQQQHKPLHTSAAIIGSGARLRPRGCALVEMTMEKSTNLSLQVPSLRGNLAEDSGDFVLNMKIDYMSHRADDRVLLCPRIVMNRKGELKSEPSRLSEAELVKADAWKIIDLNLQEMGYTPVKKRAPAIAFKEYIKVKFGPRRDLLRLPESRGQYRPSGRRRDED